MTLNTSQASKSGTGTECEGVKVVHLRSYFVSIHRICLCVICVCFISGSCSRHLLALVSKVRYTDAMIITIKKRMPERRPVNSGT